MDWVIYIYLLYTFLSLFIDEVILRKLIMHETTFDNFDTENKINNLMFFIQKKKKHQDSYVSIHMKKKMK